MKISTARVWHGILGGASLLTYLCFPIVSLGGKIELSGADIFDMANRFGNNNFWIYLFVFFPVMAIIISLIPQTKKKNHKHQKKTQTNPTTQKTHQKPKQKKRPQNKQTTKKADWFSTSC